MRGVRVFVGIVVLVVAVATAQGAPGTARAATNRAWVGGTSGNFFVASNWSPAGVPNEGDVLIFHQASNGNAHEITVFGTMSDMPRIASITTDIETLHITGAMTITKSVFIESSQRQITFDSLYVDADAGEFSMPPIPFMAYPGTVVIQNKLLVRGAVNAHGGALTVNELAGSGLITVSGSSVAFKNAEDFSGTIDARQKASLNFDAIDFAARCDRSAMRIVLDATASLRLSPGCLHAFASLEGNGQLTPWQAPTVSFALMDAQGLFNGSVDFRQPVALECCGTGAQRLGGDLRAVTEIDVMGGSLVAENLTLGNGTITNVGSGASFGGSGNLGNVAINQGTLLMGGGIGNFESLLFTSSGNATFHVLGVDAAGIGQVRMKGVLDLGSASNAGTAGTLSVQFKNGFVPAVGQQLALFTGASDVQGTFKGLPEGAVANLGGYSFKITYTGGASGHDVVVTRQASAASPTPTATPTGTPSPGGSLKYRRFIPVVGRDG